MSDANQIRILFLAASPGSMGQLNAYQEARDIREALRTTAHRDSIELFERFGVRPVDLQPTFFEVRPQIVHFCGHGTVAEEIVLQNDGGGAEPLGKRALADLFRVHKDQVRLVVLSACHSRPQVEAISEHIDCAIGMRRAIGSQAATAFSAAFYRAIGFGSSVQKAFDSAIVQLSATGIPEDRTPQLVLRPGVDASQLFVVSPASPSEPPSKPALERPGPSSAPSAPPSAPHPTVSGENRICTVMVVDFAGKSALSSRLEPSELKRHLDRYHRVVVETVEPLGGHVERRAGGDGSIGVFGALQANEGDVDRAVHAAIRIQAAFAKIRSPRGMGAVQPAARIGLTTGRVFVEVSDNGAGKSVAVTGRPLDAATRLQQAAPPGAILIGRDTGRLIAGRFNVEPVSIPPAQGSGDPTQAFRVLGVLAVQLGLSPQDFHGVDTKLVGRGVERQRLLDALEALTHRPRAAQITLVGPAGVGRSRMLAELVASISGMEPIFILSAGQGSALAMNISYGVVASMIRARFAIPEGAPPDMILRRLRRGVRWLSSQMAREERDGGRPPVSDSLGVMHASVPDPNDLEDALIQVAALLDTRKASSASGGAITPSLDGAEMKHRITRAIACFVRFAAVLSPVVVLCDDAQWADDASLDLLDDIVVRAENLPVLVVCTARPDLYERRPHWGEGKATHRRVDLAPLEDWHIEAMIRDRLRRVRDLSPEFVRVVVDRAEGNPLILDETLRFLMDARVIDAPSDGGAWIIREDRLGALTLPTTVQEIVQARIDRLDPAARSVLARAAVAGKTFWEGLVDRMRDVGGSIPPSLKTSEIIDVLRGRHLVRARETTTFPGERERVFAESATHEVAYKMLPAHQRRPLHRVVAGWLKERAPGDAHAALIARHYDLGGDLRAAAEAYERAAAYASSLGQNEEVRRHLLRVCALYDEMEEEFTGEEMSNVPWSDQARVRLDLGDVLRRLGRLDEAEAMYAKARVGAGASAGDPEATRWMVRADLRSALCLKVRGSTAAARVLVERAIVLAKEGGLPEETPAMYALLAVLYRREQMPAESSRACREGLRVCRALGREKKGSPELVARALLGLAVGLSARERWIAAERTYRQVGRIAARIGDLDLLGRALNGTAAAFFLRGDYTGAKAHFLEAIRVKQKAGDLHQIAIAHSNLAELGIKIHEYTAALDNARRAARMAEQIHAESDLGEIHRVVGAALFGLGRLDEAIDACLQALPITERAGPVYLPGILMTLVEVCESAVEVARVGSLLWAKLTEASSALMAITERSFVEVAIRARIEVIRARMGTPSN